MRLPTTPGRARLPVVFLSVSGLCALGLGATACGSSGTAVATATEVYVLNFYGAEQGRADQRPADLVLSEFSTLNKVTWRTWGPTRASGAGNLSGTWCLPHCLDKPYAATVTLSSIVPVKGKGYFARYEITAKLPPGEKGKADLSGTLPTPSEPP
ncbi:hypothetical protein N5079_17110 [Planotetraspora sp. A-T 1434]|uniref:hypothetical protein n=1 Tax=Planotetraspora sp. A-T 1434 TaxID=2979219 RepID=UPI0021BFDFEC|nr:hypothetical protein [Planotetraspora sp. A-T 1434]MCT9931925.1 hypothetical protein [Planotetraspora sp. A-T 1434]